MNILYYGDNLDILRNYVRDESVDLIYLDPPFNSNRNYNVLFREVDDVTESAAQVGAFEDTWTWDARTEATFHQIAQTCPPNLVDMMSGFVSFLGRNEMTAYLVMMAIRLVELHRVLKPTGALFLHCDPTASHYLKILLDQIFGKDRMINEVIWKRTTAKGDARRRAGNVHDVIFWYAKSSEYVYNREYAEYDQAYIDNKYSHVEEGTGRRYALDNLTSPNPRPNLTYEYKGYRPPAYGWRVSRERMEELDAEGRLYFPANKAHRIRLKRYLDEMPGVPLTDVWLDINPINSQARESLGYPTQKPVELLERIVRMASNEGDVVLDPFCGCGTTIAAAEALGREWIGIDVTHLAINLIKNRLLDTYPEVEFQVVGEPTDVTGARELAQQNRHQFEYWALSLVDARPASGEPKKGADKGIDGVLYAVDNPHERPKKIVVQVKSGKLGVSQVRDFAHVIDREKAVMGLFITLDTPTAPMLTEAAAAGVYETSVQKHVYPRLQILTVEQLLRGEQPKIPTARVTFKAAEKAQEGGKQLSLLGDTSHTDEP